MEDLQADISALKQGVNDIFQTYEGFSSDEDDNNDFPTLSQNNSPDSSLTLKEQNYTRTNSSDTFTRTSSNSDTVFPETPENHALPTPMTTTSMSYRTIDPFNPVSSNQAKRKSPQHQIPTTNRVGHRKVIAQPNEESPKRFKTSSPSPINNTTTSHQSPNHNQQLKINNTPSPSNQSVQPQRLNSNHNINGHEYNNNHGINGHQYNNNHDMNRHEYNNNNNNRNHEYNHHQQNGFAVPEYPSAPKTSQHLKLGDKDYLVLNRIGAGASSQVYSAYSIKDEKCFALKYIEIKRPEDRTNAHAEVDLLKSLINIERVAAIRQYYSIPRAIYLVMELGEIDLAHLIKKQSEKKWDFAFICYFWEQMVMAVGEIHHMNVVHCDLKPANFVLIKGVLKLIDFGISKALQDDTTNIQKDSQIGTFNYMAPESFRDLSGPSGQDVLVKQGRPSDVWALGCILYLMVYGHTPFSNISMPQKIYCIMDSKYPIPFDKTAGDSIIPQRVISILKSCLQREKYLRPTIDNLLRNPLYEI